MDSGSQARLPMGFTHSHRSDNIFIIYQKHHSSSLDAKSGFPASSNSSKKCLTERQEKFNSYHCRSSYQTWKGVNSDMAVKKKSVKKKAVKKAAKKKVAKKKK